MNKIAIDDLVTIEGFYQDYCGGTMPIRGSWQHDVCQAEKNNEACTVKKETKNNFTIYIPSARQTWWVRKEYIRKKSLIESEAEEI